jgi:hypothetical protein
MQMISLTVYGHELHQRVVGSYHIAESGLYREVSEMSEEVANLHRVPAAKKCSRSIYIELD